MKIRAASSLMLALIPVLAAREEVTRDFQKSATLRAGQRVYVDHRLGSITIRGAASREASVKAVIRASANSREEAQRIADDVQITVDDAGDFSIRTRYPESKNFFGNHNNVSYSATLDITLPESSVLEVHNRFGGVDVAGIKARTDVYATHGKLVLRDGKGDHRLENAFGPIDVLNNAGSLNIDTHNGAVSVSGATGMVDIKDRFGKITVSKVGGELRISSGNGTVLATDVGGRATITNSFGDVEVTNTGGDLRVEAHNGRIIARDVKGAAWIKTSFGKIDLTGAQKGAELISTNGGVSATNVSGGVTTRSSFGAIVLAQVTGRIDATNQNGAITVSAGRGCDPISLETRFGPIKVQLPADGNYDLSAQTSFGGIHSEFPLIVSGSINGKSVQGKIGKGGCPLKLTNSNGSIEIRK